MSIKTSNGSAGEWSVPLTSDSLHDLASPINQVCSLGDLILKKYRGALGADADQLFGLLHDAVFRLQNLLTGLRTYAQVASSAESYRHADVNALLDAARALVQPAIEEHQALLTRDALPELWCNPAQLTFALAALLDNAIKFRSEARPEIHVSSASGDAAWIVSVRDNGIGIEPVHRERIFHAFKRVQNDQLPGSGMGLTITRDVIERHGGRIWVDSAPGAGSTFFMELPKTRLAGFPAPVMR